LGNSINIVEKVVLIHHQISFLKPRVFLDKKTQPENTTSGFQQVERRFKCNKARPMQQQQCYLIQAF